MRTRTGIAILLMAAFVVMCRPADAGCPAANGGATKQEAFKAAGDAVFKIEDAVATGLTSDKFTTTASQAVNGTNEGTITVQDFSSLFGMAATTPTVPPTPSTAGPDLNDTEKA